MDVKRRFTSCLQGFYIDYLYSVKYYTRLLTGVLHANKNTKLALYEREIEHFVETGLAPM